MAGSKDRRRRKVGNFVFFFGGGGFAGGSMVGAVVMIAGAARARGLACSTSRVRVRPGAPNLPAGMAGTGGASRWAAIWACSLAFWDSCGSEA